MIYREAFKSNAPLTMYLSTDPALHRNSKARYWTQRTATPAIARNLLATSKQIYIEALPVLFDKRIFAFKSMHDLPTLLHRLGPNGCRFVQHLAHSRVVPFRKMDLSVPSKISPLIHICSRLESIRVYIDMRHFDAEGPIESRSPLCVLSGIELMMDMICLEKEPDDAMLEKRWQCHDDIIQWVAQPRTKSTEK